jgi:hypothetical protein
MALFRADVEVQEAAHAAGEDDGDAAAADEDDVLTWLVIAAALDIL